MIHFITRFISSAPFLGIVWRYLLNHEKNVKKCELYGIDPPENRQISWLRRDKMNIGGEANEKAAFSAFLCGLVIPLSLIAVGMGSKTEQIPLPSGEPEQTQAQIQPQEEYDTQTVVAVEQDGQSAAMPLGTIWWGWCLRRCRRTFSRRHFRRRRWWQEPIPASGRTMQSMTMVRYAPIPAAVRGIGARRIIWIKGGRRRRSTGCVRRWSRRTAWY